jgi:hypothetical protein
MLVVNVVVRMFALTARTLTVRYDVPFLFVELCLCSTPSA